MDIDEYDRRQAELRQLDDELEAQDHAEYLADLNAEQEGQQ